MADSVIQVPGTALAVVCIILMVLLLAVLTSMWILIYLVYKERSRRAQPVIAAAGRTAMDEEQSLGQSILDPTTIDKVKVGTLFHDHENNPEPVCNVASHKVIPTFRGNSVFSNAKSDSSSKVNVNDNGALDKQNHLVEMADDVDHLQGVTILEAIDANASSRSRQLSRSDPIFVDSHINSSGMSRRTTYIDESEDSDLSISSNSSSFSESRTDVTVFTESDSTLHSKLCLDLGSDLNFSSILKDNYVSEGASNIASKVSTPASKSERRRADENTPVRSISGSSEKSSSVSPNISPRNRSRRSSTPRSVKLQSALSSTINLSEAFELCSVTHVNLANNNNNGTYADENDNAGSPLKHKRGDRTPLKTLDLNRRARSVRMESILPYDRLKSTVKQKAL